MASPLIVAVCLAILWAPPGRWSGGNLRSGVRRPAVLHVQTVVGEGVSITKAELEMVQGQLTRIWQQEGIAVELTASATAHGGLRLVFSGELIRVAPTARNVCDLGVIRFTEGAPEPELTVSVTAAREFVREAHPEWSPAIRTLIAARVAGRVAAHELGHYLLADPRHRSAGLMRAHFDGIDLLGPALAPFAPPHYADLEAGLIRAMATATR